VLVCPNYAGRWIDEAHISNAPERVNLPIRNFVGANDTLCSQGSPIHTQMMRAVTMAGEHGYKNVALVQINGKGHERLAAEALDYFSSLLK
jgi:surfactin synthase thioesterase subunit